MEGKASERIALCSILFVSRDGMTYPFGVYSDLILASGFQFEFHLGVCSAVDVDVLECPAMGCSKLPVLARRSVRVVLRSESIAMDLHGFGILV